METKDAMGLYQVGKLLGRVLYQMGNKEEGTEMLRRSLAIGKAAKFPDVGKIEEILKKFGE